MLKNEMLVYEKIRWKVVSEVKMADPTGSKVIESQSDRKAGGGRKTLKSQSWKVGPAR